MKNKHLLLITCLGFSFQAWAAGPKQAMSDVPAQNDEQVTLMNQTMQPYNHWAFRNAGISSSVMVPRAGTISALPEAIDPSIADIAFSYQGKELYRAGGNGVG